VGIDVARGVQKSVMLPSGGGGGRARPCGGLLGKLQLSFMTPAGPGATLEVGE